MRLVPHAAIRPHRCAVIPFIGNSNTKRGFFDTGVDLPGWDPHVYVSVEAVEQMASQVGWQPNQIAAGYARQVKDRDQQIGTLEARIAELEQQVSAVQVLKAAGYTAARKPGRPPKAKAVA